MNKQFMIVNGTIIVSTDNGINEPIAYRDNIEDILTFENEIEYLKKRLSEDEEYLDKQKNERESKRKMAKNVALTATGAVLAASGGSYIFCNSVPELANQPIINQMIGTICGVGIMYSMLIGGLGLTFGPSKNIISCYEERISFEKEMIEILSKELEILRANNTNNKKDNYKEFVAYNINDKGAIKYLSDSIKLRDFYGYSKAKILKLYFNDELIQVLRERKFDENAIMDFMTYLDTKCREDKEISYSVNSLKK